MVELKRHVHVNPVLRSLLFLLMRTILYPDIYARHD